MVRYLAVSWAYATIGSDVGDKAVGEHACTPASAHQPEGSKAVTARCGECVRRCKMTAIFVLGCSRSEAVQRSWFFRISSLIYDSLEDGMCHLHFALRTIALDS